MYGEQKKKEFINIFYLKISNFDMSLLSLRLKVLSRAGDSLQIIPFPALGDDSRTLLSGDSSCLRICHNKTWDWEL